MPITTSIKRIFRRDDEAYQSFLRREEKYRRRCRPGHVDDGGPDADRLRYEMFRARI